MEHFCEIILKSGIWPRMRCLLNIFFLILVIAAIVVQCTGIILAILVKEHKRKVSVK